MKSPVRVIEDHFERLLLQSLVVAPHARRDGRSSGRRQCAWAEWAQAAVAVAREQRLLITHGTFDPVVPFAPSKLQFQMLRSNGLSIEWHEFEKEHTIDGESELSVIRRFIQASFEE